jgi:hypothetical protein
LCPDQCGDYPPRLQLIAPRSRPKIAGAHGADQTIRRHFALVRGVDAGPSGAGLPLLRLPPALREALPAHLGVGPAPFPPPNPIRNTASSSPFSFSFWSSNTATESAPRKRRGAISGSSLSRLTFLVISWRGSRDSQSSARCATNREGSACRSGPGWKKWNCRPFWGPT